MNKVKFSHLLLLLVLFSISLISCDDDGEESNPTPDDEVVQTPEEEEEEEEIIYSLDELKDAHAIAISLDTLRKVLLREVADDGFSGNLTIHPMDLSIDGTKSGKAILVGADSVFATGGHSGGNARSHGTVNFKLEGYSNTHSVILENSGEIRYNEYINWQTNYCWNGQCPSETVNDTVKILATGLNVSFTTPEKKIQDVIDINFLYTRSYKTFKKVVQDSSHYNHYKITTSKGVVFEW